MADEPVEKRLWTADSTVEKIGVLLNENPDGIRIPRDELTGWLKMLDRPGFEQEAIPDSDTFGLRRRT